MSPSPLVCKKDDNSYDFLEECNKRQSIDGCIATVSQRKELKRPKRYNNRVLSGAEQQNCIPATQNKT